MVEEELRSGQLVRYLHSSARWYFAVVRRVRREEVELSFFVDGRDRLVVARAKVETFSSFFASRENVYSRTRSQLSALFYDREFERLREDRCREMQQALRKAGIRFEPEEWPTPDTRIRLFRDESVVVRDRLEPQLASLLPQWLEPFVLPAGSRDPLGLQAPAERLVNEVLPGLNVFTFRAGYYGFLAWAIRCVNAMSESDIPPRSSRREILNACERALALCEFVHHGNDDDSCILIGQRSRARVLSACEADRYRVPDSILKNQNSAGSFRLFSTSLVSLGLALESDALGADGRLPFELTSIGHTVANAFERRIDPSFLSFARGEKVQRRDVLRDWGRNLCFSSLGHRGHFRSPLLEGFLLGNSRDAEKRYQTVRHLFAEGLLDTTKSAAQSGDTLNEDDAASSEEEVPGVGASNLDVVLHFYSIPPRSELRSLQAVAVFELVSLGLSAIFRGILASVIESGRAKLAELAGAISTQSDMAPFWAARIAECNPLSARDLVAALQEATDPMLAASIGGVILIRVIRDPLLSSVWDTLASAAAEPMALLDRCLLRRMDHFMAQALPELILAMIERHEVVSHRKNRQRWIFAEEGDLVRDDARLMGLGLHALRFPQLGSLARDLNLRQEDLHHG